MAMVVLSISVFLMVLVCTSLINEFAVADEEVTTTGLPLHDNGVRPELVETYALNFIQEVLADSKLKSAFELPLQLNSEDAKNIYYDIVFKVNAALGDRDPAFSARMVAEAVASNFKKATTESLIGIYAYSSGNVIFLQGGFTKENVKELSQKLFEDIKKSLSAVDSSSPEANIRAIATGFVDFLVYRGFLRKQTTEFLAGFFSIEWYKLQK